MTLCRGGWEKSFEKEIAKYFEVPGALASGRRQRWLSRKDSGKQRRPEREERKPSRLRLLPDSEREEVTSSLATRLNWTRTR